MNAYLSAFLEREGGGTRDVCDIPATLIYLWISLDIALTECGLFAVTAFSLWAVGVGLILGPYRWRLCRFRRPADSCFCGGSCMATFTPATDLNNAN
jgi:hypothetical protein